MRSMVIILLAACAAPLPQTSADTFGETFSGSFHLGPVDWAESQWTNSCGPYPADVQQLEGVYLAGVDVSHNGDGRLCDACALVTTGLGKSLLVRIITTGQSNASGDMDLSPQAFELLNGMDPAATPQNPRPMTWQLARCSDAGSTIRLQYQTQSNPYWTSLWVRNARLPLEKVEVQKGSTGAFTALRRETDGTWNLDSGFGEGAFTLRVTASGGATTSQSFSGFSAGAVVETTMQFD